MKSSEILKVQNRIVVLALIVLTVGSICGVFVATAADRSSQSQFAGPTPKERKQRPKNTTEMIERKNEATPTPTPKALTPVALGVWGADGARLTVEDAFATIEFGCSNAEIAEPVSIDSDGKFSAAGVFIRRRPGFQRDGDEPQRLPATFSGTVKGKEMNLKMTLDESGETIGEYLFEHGRSVRIQRRL